MHQCLAALECSVVGDTHPTQYRLNVKTYLPWGAVSLVKHPTFIAYARASHEPNLICSKVDDTPGYHRCETDGDWRPDGHERFVADECESHSAASPRQRFLQPSFGWLVCFPLCLQTKHRCRSRYVNGSQRSLTRQHFIQPAVGWLVCFPSTESGHVMSRVTVLRPPS